MSYVRSFVMRLGGREIARSRFRLIHREVRGRGTASFIVTDDTRMIRHADRTVDIVDGRPRDATVTPA